jgi:hypothetical protein
MASRIKIVMRVDLMTSGGVPEEIGDDLPPEEDSAVEDLDQWRCMVGRCDCADQADHLI